MKERIIKHFENSIETKKKIIDTLIPTIEAAADKILSALKDKKKVLFFGNGGSASDAQHLAAELVGRYELDRDPLPAIALNTDTSILTAIGNDYGYSQVYAKQVLALGQSGDIALGISTSGKSENVNLAIKAAKSKGMYTIAFTGKDGGQLAELADLAIIVPSTITAHIQEAHITMGQVICGLVESSLFAQAT